MGFMVNGILIPLFVLVCLFLILLVLIQKGRGGGLASAFGGMGGNTAFGSKTGDVLTWATSVVFGVFLLLAIVLNLISNARTAPQPIAHEGAQKTAKEAADAAIPDAAALPVPSDPVQTAPPVADQPPADASAVPSTQGT